MNLDIFNPNNSDGALLAYIKREALVRILEYKDENSEYWYQYFEALCNFVKNGSIAFIEQTIEFKDNLRHQIPICPISITKNDFEVSKYETLAHHKRTFDIVWNTTVDINSQKSIYNKNAFNINIRRKFDFIKHEVTDISKTEGQYTIFISKGGVINGEFIDLTYLYKDSYKDEKILLKLPIIIPVCEVIYNTKKITVGTLYAVDHREPMLRRLLDEYDCPKCINEEISSLKLNLRYCANEYNTKKDYKSIIFNQPVECVKNKYKCEKESNGTYNLLTPINGNYEIVATWKDGILTIYYNKIRWKKVNTTVWSWFTGYSLANLKIIRNHGNKNIIIL